MKKIVVHFIKGLFYVHLVHFKGSFEVHFIKKNLAFSESQKLETETVNPDFDRFAVAYVCYTYLLLCILILLQFPINPKLQIPLIM